MSVVNEQVEIEEKEWSDIDQSLLDKRNGLNSRIKFQPSTYKEDDRRLLESVEREIFEKSPRDAWRKDMNSREHLQKIADEQYAELTKLDSDFVSQQRAYQAARQTLQNSIDSLRFSIGRTQKSEQNLINGAPLELIEKLEKCQEKYDSVAKDFQGAPVLPILRRKLERATHIEDIEVYQAKIDKAVVDIENAEKALSACRQELLNA